MIDLLREAGDRRRKRGEDILRELLEGEEESPPDEESEEEPPPPPAEALDFVRIFVSDPAKRSKQSDSACATFPRSV